VAPRPLTAATPNGQPATGAGKVRVDAAPAEQARPSDLSNLGRRIGVAFTYD
jgi:hypothetical protein